MNIFLVEGFRSITLKKEKRISLEAFYLGRIRWVYAGMAPLMNRRT